MQIEWELKLGVHSLVMCSIPVIELVELPAWVI